MDGLGKSLVLSSGAACPCCGSRAPARCWPASSRTEPCGCEVCYFCYRVHAMSRQSTRAPLSCPSCKTPTTGALVGRGELRLYETTPPLPTPEPETETETETPATANSEVIENCDPNLPPAKKKRTKAPECAVCQRAGLSTPTSTRMGSALHNRPCPLSVLQPEPETEVVAPGKEPRDRFVNAGHCTRASNAPAYRGPRIVLQISGR
jgi:hypothetical protein